MILQTVGLKKYFESIKAVDMVNLQIEEGEVSSIIGPNGAGKTTLFNVIAGQLRCDSGKVFFKGKDITNLSPHKVVCKRIGKCFQISSVFRGLTVFENIQVAAISRRGKSLDFYSPAHNVLTKEVFGVLKSVGLQDKAGRRADSLSYGDQKRLEIGIALATMPELLLLDEPTGGIGPAEAQELMSLIRSLAKEQGLTVVFIEHDMNVVFNFSDKVRVMHMGKIILEGKPEEVRDNPEVRRIYLGEEKGNARAKGS